MYPCILHKKCYNITKADAIPENRLIFKGRQTDKAIAKEHYSMRALNLTLLTDLYELTMMQGYFKNPTDQVVVFDAFYRKNPCDGGYAIAAGLEQIIEYIRDLHFTPDDIDYLKSLKIFDADFLEYLRGFHFTGDIYAIPRGP